MPVLDLFAQVLVGYLRGWAGSGCCSLCFFARLFQRALGLVLLDVFCKNLELQLLLFEWRAVACFDLLRERLVLFCFGFNFQLFLLDQLLGMPAVHVRVQGFDLRLHAGNCFVLVFPSFLDGGEQRLGCRCARSCLHFNTGVLLPRRLSLDFGQRDLVLGVSFPDGT